jgi:pimeloyl-ACP methyl ester carboxylesterase
MSGVAPTRRRSILALVAGLSWVATSLVVAPAGQGAPARPAPADTRSESSARSESLGWHACAAAPAPFECTEVAVPVDHARPAAGSRDVAVIRLPAQGPGPTIGTLMINPGGPGISGVTFLPAALPVLLDGLAARFDLVSFDPRGVGETGPVRCLEDAERDAAIARAQGLPDVHDLPVLLADAATLVARCRANHGADLRTVSSVTVARDMDRIRSALGAEQISYLGFSYGTYLGATYASLFPDRLRAVVLDAAVDPVQTARHPLEKDIDQAVGFEVGLGRFLDHCDATPSECAFAGDARARFERLLARVDRQPLPAPSGDPNRPVTSHTMVTGVQAALYARQSWPFLGQALATAEAGDGGLLQFSSDTFIGRDESGRYLQWVDAALAIVAVDRDYPRSVRRFVQAADTARQRAPTFGALNVYASLPAGLWPVEPAEDFDGPFTFRSSGPPALVVGTTFDTATPYRGAQAMTDQLGHAVLLTMDGDGHAAYGRGSACLDEAVDAYLMELSVPAPGTTCRQDVTPSDAAAFGWPGAAWPGPAGRPGGADWVSPPLGNAGVMPDVEGRTARVAPRSASGAASAHHAEGVPCIAI